MPILRNPFSGSGYAISRPVIPPAPAVQPAPPAPPVNVARISARMLEHLRFVLLMDHPPITCCRRGADHQNQVTHDALVRRGLLVVDFDGHTHLTAAGRRIALPKRIQLRRAKGWRKPPGAIVVSRPSKWGNPMRVGTAHGRTPGEVVAKFRRLLLAEGLRITTEDVARELRGKDLACWCPLGSPCHADVLIEVANG